MNADDLGFPRALALFGDPERQAIAIAPDLWSGTHVPSLPIPLHGMIESLDEQLVTDFEDTLPPFDRVHQYMPLVRRMARLLILHAPARLELERMIHAGMMALLEADRVYDRTDCDSFRIFSVRRIRRAMLDELQAVEAHTQGLR